MKLGVSINKNYVREDGKCAVRMSVSLRGDREWYTFPFAIEPKRWDDRLRRVRPGVNAIEYNRTIAAVVSRAEVLGLEQGITARDIVLRLKAEGEGSPKPAISAMRSAIKLHTERFAESTQVVMNTMLNDLEKHLSDIRLGELTPHHVQAFHRSMKERGLDHNTISKRLRNMRTAYFTALSDHRMETPKIFHRAIPPEKPTRKRMLRPAEVQRLADFHCEDRRLMLAKHALLLQIFLGGIRIGDLIRLTHDLLRRRGQWELEYSMGKTGEEAWVPIAEQAAAIIDHYRGGTHLLPLYCGDHRHDIAWATAKVNGPLKVIAATCDLPRDLSTHYARHTFGDWARKHNVPLKRLQMIFRHKDIKTTMVYMASFDEQDVGETFADLSRSMPQAVL